VVADAAAGPNIALRSQMVAIRCRPELGVDEGYHMARFRYRSVMGSPVTWVVRDFNHPDLAVPRV